MVDKYNAFSVLVDIVYKLQKGALTMNPEKFFFEQISEDRLLLLPTIFRTAYACVDLLVKTEPFLQTPAAKYQIGRLKSMAAEYAMQKLIDSQQWPYSYEWLSYHRQTGKYLRIKLNNSFVIITQMAPSSQFPRLAIYRENAAFDSQMFFEFMKEPVSGNPTFHLVHGHQNLTHIYFGLPHPTENHYIFKTNNILTYPSLIKTPVEEIDLAAVITLKEEIMKQNGKDYAG